MSRSTSAEATRDRPSRLWLLLAVAAALLLIVVWARVFRQSGDQGASHPAAGQRLPAIALQGLARGTPNVSNSDLLGSVTLINFWAPWCYPCREELPHLMAIDSDLKGPDFQLLPVLASDGSDDDLEDLGEQAEAFMRDAGLKLRPYADQQGKTRLALARVGAFEESIPATIVVDRRGIIRGVWTGYQPGDERDVKALAAKLLAERPSGPG